MKMDDNLQKLMQTDAFAKKLLSLTSLMDPYEDPNSQSEALNIIISSPVYERVEEEENILKNTSNSTSESTSSDYTDRLVKQLLKYLWNMEDHVWCEYYSSNLNRWVHLDCCENAFDNPLLYNQGWAKKMSYIFAISEHYIRDVTLKYIAKDLNRTIPRDKISQLNLGKVLALINLSQFSAIQDDDILLEVSSDLIHDYRNMNGSSITPQAMLPRQSGILTSAKEVANLVEYFLDSKRFFYALSQCSTSISQSELQTILLAFYRLISADRQKFIRFIDPVLLHTAITTDSTSDINKYLAILLESSYLSIAEDVKLHNIEKYVDKSKLIGVFDKEPSFNYEFISLFEGQRLSNLSKLPFLSECLESNGDVNCISFVTEDLSPGVRIIGGVLVPHIRELENERLIKTPSEFIPIKKSVDSLRKLATHVRASDPVLLIGKTGSGKSFLVNEIAKMLGVDTSNLIKIHLNHQTDPKLLLGTYTSGSKPGTFEWKNGVLTTAVKEGKWVLVEDIDKAPNEVLSILLSLLETRELTISSRGDVIRAANGFQLISTICESSDSDEITIPDMIGLRLWKTIILEDLNHSDLLSILKSRFPLLEHFIKPFITAFFNIKEIYESRKIINMNNGVPPRPISIRDLMRFCKRSNKLLLDSEIKDSNDMVSDSLYDFIFQEAVDCFTSALSSNDAIKLLTAEVGKSLEIPTSRIELQFQKTVPPFEEYEDSIRIGRAHVSKHHIIGIHKNGRNNPGNSRFARTSCSLRLMEKVGVGISMCEPLVLVGETGTGKTTIVQEMAKLLNKKLTVINMSQQTEVGDLLGGFKPVSTKLIALPIQEDFEDLFSRSFSTKKNSRYLQLLSKCFNRSQWKKVVRLWKEAYKMTQVTYDGKEEGTSLDVNESGTKKKRKLNETDISVLLNEWSEMYQKVCSFEKQFKDTENSFVFQFVEGSLVKAVKNGDWVLLDEINLASTETLDSISDLLADEELQRSILLTEKGDVESIRANSGFRIFGCMNPATDVGKRNLPSGIRSKFTEIYVHSPDEDISDLLMIIDNYIGKFSLSDEWVGNDIAELYLSAKRFADAHKIVDGANQKPQFSIRTLTRTLLYVQDIIQIYGLRRSLYEGFCMSFLTLLDKKSEGILHPLIQKFTVSRLKNAKSVLRMIPPNPDPSGEAYAQFKHYWIRKGQEIPVPQDSYIITPFVEKNLLNLVRATSGRRFPVLLQGPTSAGKTSMINYLAKITGHKFVRINNHEHTDLQEYLGTYVSDDTGKLSFREGILVEALRNGYWIVLDELNLAPTDVLEALNRLLDDNRELFIPETQEVVTPHPEFMLFATQNPPGLYGGRKILSKAFRNRFLELHYDDIPQDELEIILRDRCQIAPSYAKKIVEVYRELSVERQTTRLFEQKHSFATLRDLFRWAGRDAVGYEQLAANGYMLLAERVRRPEEKLVVRQVLEKVMRVKLNMDAYYTNLENKDLLLIKSSVIWTKAMRRLAVLVSLALNHHEPVLLVGETGCGKTTIFQLLSRFIGKELIMVNVHQNTETSDLLGAQRPVRNRSQLQQQLIQKIIEVSSRAGVDVSTIDSLSSALISWKENKININISDEDMKAVEYLLLENNALFEWSDGPLVSALKKGCHFLLDEISLADDSVLERLNSVLEPERTILLAEKGPDDSLVVAADGFQFFATMNPGGDYGKKELSPALRNRFTEIWVPSMEDFEDVTQIVSAKLNGQVKKFTDTIVNFSRYYGLQLGGGKTDTGVISLRDILAWIQFINFCHDDGIDDHVALLHGACMVFIDALGTHSTSYLAENEEKLRDVKLSFVNKLSEFVKMDLAAIYSEKAVVTSGSDHLLCGHFKIGKKMADSSISSFSLQAPTTAANAMRVARALQVRKPILLEGSPGVGKTSLITALASSTGNKLTRINLSEQTDLIDLFGSDSPVQAGRVGEFEWRDGPFLRAMQKGEWVLLDEMNLASQSVLEGLNACLDHRGEAFIPELDRSFVSHPDFRVFAAQNPQSQGGGRKGLPKSFINRFTVVYVDTLKEYDLKLIATHLYPNIDLAIRDNLINFMSALEKQVVVERTWGSSGQPWEFNLRDTLRWLSLLNSGSIANTVDPVDFFQLVIRQRFRTLEDRSRVDELFESVFGAHSPRDPYFDLKPSYIQVKNEVIIRNAFTQYTADTRLVGLQSNIGALETLMRCIKMSYPCLLVGPSGSGKSELIKYCASIIGSRVFELSMNSDIDSMDILGGFEQSDLNRSLAEILDDILVELLNTVSLQMSLDSCKEEAVRLALSIISIIVDANVTVDSLSSMITSLNDLSILIHSDGLAQFVRRLSTLKIESEKPSSVNFQWFDGLLVQAVEKGYWLVLDNANLCSPSVLDRINSLLELNGRLVVSECTDDEGASRTIIPHKNFRLFLTSDPKYGELSRAMRNRAVEIYLQPLTERATTFDIQCLGLSSSQDSTISSRLGNMDLDQATGYRPITSFVSCSDSKTRDYALILDALNLTDGHFERLVLDFAGLDILNELPLLLDSCISLPEFEHSQMFSNTLDYLNFLHEKGIPDQLFKVYERSLQSSQRLQNIQCSLASYQTFCASLNEFIQPLLALNFKFVSLSSEPHYFVQDIMMFFDSTQYLQGVCLRAEKSKMVQLNPLERSAAMILGRDTKRPPKYPLYTLVNSVYQFIGEALLQGSRADLIFMSPTYFQSIFYLELLLVRIIKASESFNESYVRVHQDELLDWLDHNSALYEPASINRLSTKVHSFASQMKLSRGLSMSLIWNSSRADYPTTSEAWSHYQTLSSIGNRFDAVSQKQFPETYQTITKMRVLFVEMLKACKLESCSSDLLVFEEKAEQEVSVLEQITDGFLLQRNCSFTRLFDTLLAFTESGMLNAVRVIPLSESILTLSLLGARPTIALTRYSDITDLFKPYPAIFDSLWSKSGDGKMKVDIVDDEFFRQLFRSANNIKNSPGGQIENSLSDLSFMLTQLVSQSKFIIEDHISQFKNLAYKWIHYICSLHIKTLPIEVQEQAAKLFDESSYDDYASLMSANGLDSFVSIFRNYFLSSLTTTCDDFSSLGSAWVKLAFGMILLYVPNSTFDPATLEHATYEGYLELQNVVTGIHQSFEHFRRVAFGDSEIQCERFLPQVPDSKVPEKPQVYRFTNSSTEELSNEWTSFFDAYLDKNYVDMLVQAAEDLSASSISKVNNFEINSSQFIMRLKDGYPLFSDLNDILVGYIYGLKFGFELLQKGASQKSFVLRSPLWITDPVALGTASIVNLSFEDSKSVCKNCSVNKSDADKTYFAYLRIANFHNDVAEQADSNSFFNQSLLGLYYRWSMRNLKQEEKDSTQQGIYKFSDPTIDVEGDFESLFPEAGDLLDASVSRDSKQSDTWEDLYSQIASVYIDIFRGKKSSATEIFDGILALSPENLASFEAMTHATRSGGNSASALLLSTLSIYDELTKSFSQDGNDSGVDFYHGYSPFEIKFANGIVKTLQGSVRGLLKKWPENATLQELFRISTEFLAYPVNTPVYRLLGKVEQIYTYVAQWEEYAHSGVSLGDHASKLSALVVRWRKLELSSWKKVLENEEDRVVQLTGKWWFHLFETILLPAIKDELYEEERVQIVGAVNIFLSQSTYGDFGYRMDLLNAFAVHIRLMAEDSLISDSLFNVIAFYRQFEGLSFENIKSVRTQLEKDVKDVILLASWKDINIDALKQSSQKSHRALYKIMRKYRGVLVQPIRPLIEQGINLTSEKDNSAQLSSLASLSPVAIDADVMKLITPICAKLSSWNERQARLRDISVVSKNMEIYIKNLNMESYPTLHDFADSIIEHASLLRKQTPEELTDDNKTLCNSLKSAKRRLLSDTLRELKRIGLKLHLTTEITSALSSVTGILATCKSLPKKSFGDDVDKYFFRMLDLLPRLRSAVRDSNPEFPPIAAHKCLAAAETLLSTLVVERDPIFEVVKLSKYVDCWIEEISQITFSSDHRPISSSKSEFCQQASGAAESLLNGLPLVFEYAKKSISIAGSRTHETYDEKVFDDALMGLNHYDTIKKHLIYSVDNLNDLEQLGNFIESLRLNLMKWKNSNENVAFIANYVLEWLAEQPFMKLTLARISDFKTTTLDEVEKSLRALCLSIMLCIQEMSKIHSEKSTISSEEDKWLQHSQKRLVKYFKLLHSSLIIKQLRQFIIKLSSVEYSDETSTIASALVEQALPLVYHYKNLISVIECKLTSNYVDLSTSVYDLSSLLFNLARDGFCSPQKPSKAPAESGEMKDGTGLGDGEGANNKSNDVEDDEDLSEQAQQDNAEENKDDDGMDEDNDDAVSIEGDMAGNLEELSEKEDEENDEKSGEEEDDEEDLDDEVDDIDDTDPGAIDDKMWDENAADDSKEKESEKMPEDSKPESDEMQEMDEKNDDGREKNDNNEPQEKNETENDSEAEDEEDVGEQEDEVKQADDDDKLDDNVPEGDALNLPEDIDLDSSGESESESGEEEEGEKWKDDLDEMTDDKEEDNAEEGEDQEQEDENNEGKDQEDNEADSEEKEEEGAESEDVALSDNGVNDENGEESERDDVLMDVDEEKDSEEGKEESKENLEGVEGDQAGQEADDDIDEDAAAQQQSGVQTEGAQAGIDQEEDNVGGDGGSANIGDQEKKDAEEKDEEKEEENDQHADSSREKASKSLKQLGDAMKEFHRRHQEIKETTDDDMVDQKAGENPDEFQHLESESAENETQALGSTSKDQLQTIDEDMAIDDEKEDEELEKETNETDEENDEDSGDTQGVHKDTTAAENGIVSEEEDENALPKDNGTVVGERKKQEIDIDEDDESENLSDAMLQSTDVEASKSLRPYEEAQKLWMHADEATRDLTSGLLEQLRLILEPTLATKLRGDYKTGKRLNMKRIIPYIASQFRKDKIWMRRTKPSKRQYQIMIAVDDSKSMAESNAVDIAFQSISLVSKALTQLESGQLAISKFGADSLLVHPFEKPFNTASGIQVFRHFEFDETRTDVKNLVAKSLSVFNEARATGDSDLWQLQIILSDGVCEDHSTLQRLVRKAREEKIMIVFVIIDCINNQESILDMSQVTYEPDSNGQMQLQMNKYLDTFPFEYYVVVHNIKELPEMLALILRQYFSEILSA
ncbi:hypothetical protein FOA43_000208 [Brettanomyces nanus]|uniref:Midasin n=1 Tax=Eeniella nana TaxID=13502 RepID=A0A875RXZ7_EENNA|nr:uncharacterized protein FOA43_000208 [Brettanomyces nanus]QPG72905.1 hypothetical protein FOA43_000208 [Brettanomyces nanus]